MWEGCWWPLLLSLLVAIALSTTTLAATLKSSDVAAVQDLVSAFGGSPDGVPTADCSVVASGTPLTFGCDSSSGFVTSLVIVYGSGSIPDSTSKLVALTKLRMEKVTLDVDLPDSLSALQRLRELAIVACNMYAPDSSRPSVPGFIGSLSALKKLDLSMVGFDSPVPEWAALQSMETMLLGFNSFANLPSTWGTFRNLSHLDMRNNYPLLDSIPSSWGTLSKLSHLDLSFNKVYGFLPSSFSWPALTYLNLQSNLLTGPIPLWAQLISNLNLRENYFTCTLDSRACASPNPSAFSSNCLSLTTGCPPSDPATQNDAPTCSAFCGAGVGYTPAAACSGAGLCAYDDSSYSTACVDGPQLPTCDVTYFPPPSPRPPPFRGLPPPKSPRPRSSTPPPSNPPQRQLQLPPPKPKSPPPSLKSPPPSLKSPPATPSRPPPPSPTKPLPGPPPFTPKRPPPKPLSKR